MAFGPLKTRSRMEPVPRCEPTSQLANDIMDNREDRLFVYLHIFVLFCFVFLVV